MKVSIVGLGRVGTALGLALVIGQTSEELVLVGRDPVRTAAEVLDLRNGAALGGRVTRVRGGDLTATAGSDIVVIAAGIHDQHADRAAGANGNAALLRDLLPSIASSSPRAVLVVITNPVDAMTTLALRLSGFPSERVLGLGTLLDTMRLRDLLGDHLSVRPADIRAYVLGEHGDSQFVAWSTAGTGSGGLGLSSSQAEDFEAQVRSIGYDIVRAKGHTSQGTAIAASALVTAIARDAHEVMPVSALVPGSADVGDVCLSLPVVIGRGGLVGRVPTDLSDAELSAFRRSAAAVRRTVAALGERGQGEP